VSGKAVGKSYRAKGGAGRVKRVFISHPNKDDPKGNKKRVDTINKQQLKTLRDRLFFIGVMP